MKKLAGLPIVLFAAYGLLHLLGYRDDASILSGFPARHPVGGALYVLAYFGAVLVAPIASLASGMLLVWRWATRSRAGRGRPPARVA